MQQHMKQMQSQQTQSTNSGKSATPTKDRLRAKLEKKNAEKTD